MHANTHQDPNDLFGFSFASQCVNPSITSLHVSFGSQRAQLTNGEQNKRNEITQSSLCVFLLIREVEMEHRDNRNIMETYKNLIQHQVFLLRCSVVTSYFKAASTFQRQLPKFNDCKQKYWFYLKMLIDEMSVFLYSIIPFQRESNSDLTKSIWKSTRAFDFVRSNLFWKVSANHQTKQIAYWIQSNCSGYKCNSFCVEMWFLLTIYRSVRYFAGKSFGWDAFLRFCMSTDTHRGCERVFSLTLALLHCLLRTQTYLFMWHVYGIHSLAASWSIFFMSLKIYICVYANFVSSIKQTRKK